tara:strand:- start:15440 stop:15907 length:468 start_codon:yes stop_codon:yes gene_type:complete
MNKMQPIDTAWNILKARRPREATPISMAGGNAPIRSHDDMGMGSSPGARRGAEKREMDRMMQRQRRDEMMGEMRDPLEMGEEEDLMDELNPRREAIAPRPAPPASPAMAKPDPVSPEFIQQLMAEGGSFGLPPKLQQAAEEMRRKEMADKLIGMG